MGRRRMIRTAKDSPATVLIDAREQAPLPLQALIDEHALPFVVERGTLRTADYALAGLEHLCLVERKSLPDLVACVGFGRDRFERELVRMQAEAEWPILLCEFSVSEITARRYRGRVAPSQILGSIASWTLDYRLRVLLAGTREGAAHLLLRIFGAVVRRAARRAALAEEPAAIALLKGGQEFNT